MNICMNNLRDVPINHWLGLHTDMQPHAKLKSTTGITNEPILKIKKKRIICFNKFLLKGAIWDVWSFTERVEKDMDHQSI